MLNNDLNDVIDFITSDCGSTGSEDTKWEHNLRDPAIYYNEVPKNEHFFSFTAQYTDEDWDKLMMKLRLYVIPSSLFVLFERIVTKVRFFLERGSVIQIGHKWPHGGADRLADCLGVLPGMEKMPILVEGDVKNFDQSVWERLVNLYYSMALVYDDPSSPDYEVRVRVTKLLLRNVLVRMTHLFGPVWGVQTGGVPSGKLDTSHCDSWVMAFWLFNFMTFQVMNAAEEDRYELEELLYDTIKAIVYGDDHAWNKSTNPLGQRYFSGFAFANFMKVYFDVDVRDVLDGIPFLSETFMGRVVRRGLTFLRHQFVRNPEHGKGAQCKYLPFRETREFIVRAAWGHESKERTPLDVMLSCMGHAYSTYASNHDAYTALLHVYTYALRASGLQETTALERIMNSTSENDLKDMRRKGIDTADLMHGFPRWDLLVRKNEWIDAYHVIGGDISAVNDEEWVAAN